MRTPQVSSTKVCAIKMPPSDARSPEIRASEVRIRQCESLERRPFEVGAAQISLTQVDRSKKWVKEIRLGKEPNHDTLALAVDPPERGQGEGSCKGLDVTVPTGPQKLPIEHEVG